jgi:hypothetical protein
VAVPHRRRPHPLRTERSFRSQGLKQSLPRFIRERNPLNLLSAPLIYSLIVPIAILDAWLTVYQCVCFRLYRIARVDRSTYTVIDRQHLAYLNAIEKLTCVYCGYANGVFAYTREIAGRTEQYCRPICTIACRTGSSIAPAAHGSARTS